MATKKPTGLSIARNGSNFTCTWKKGEAYNKGQQFGTFVSGGKWSSTNIGKNVTSKNYALPLSSFYPSASRYLHSIKFRVRGKKGSKWSAWTDKEFAVNYPNTPTVTVTPDTSITNKCVFAWATTTSTTDSRIFVDCEYQSMLLSNCNVTNGSKLSWTNTGTNDWKSATGLSASSSTTITETISISTGTHTRWFRIRARGPKGVSPWVYGKRVYAAPNQTIVNDIDVVDTTGGSRVYVNWSGTSNAAYPIDTLSVEYTVVTPDAGMVCPPGATPTEASVVAQRGADNAVSFETDLKPGVDEALYIRVNSTHLLDTTYGAWTLTSVGTVKAPTITSVVTDPATFRATITASNTSAISDSFLAVLYRTASEPDNYAVLGVIPHNSSSVTVQAPDWTGNTIQFGVQAIVGSYTATTRADGVGSYAITSVMESGIVWQAGTVPNAPSSVTVSPTSVTGSVKVKWNWSWSDADSAVISWADHNDAWQSTDEPESYTVSNVHAAEWIIAGLETGKRWYIRVQLVSGVGESAIHGPWSDIAVIDLSSAPNTPVLALSSGIIPVGGSVSAFWAYVSGDGTAQAYAEITEAEVDGNGINYGVYALSTDSTVDNNKTYYEYTGGVYVPQTPVGTENPASLGWYEIVSAIIAHTETAQHITIYADEVGWNQDETHYLCVRTVSGSGRVSDGWSDPVPVTIAAPLTASITATSLVQTTEIVDGVTRTFNALTTMPLTVTATGAGTGGTTTLIIERAADYHIDRPDGTDFNGYEGETIYVYSQIGESQMSVDRNDLIGVLDDGAPYRIIVTVEDGLGQAATATKEFEVRWSHQAIFPEATVSMLDTVAFITPTEPTGYQVGDTVDIYRLSVDRPELIVQGGAMEVTYVDPYPAIGEYGGHRIVYRTIDGDYITSDNEIAWLDLDKNQGDYLDFDGSIIDFGGQEIVVKYNLDVSNTWTKDFKETKYLGGSVQGDWNKGFSRTGSLNGLVVKTTDPETIQQLKLLATWDGICHMRTPDGSSFACDIEVSDEMSHSTAGKAYEVTLNVTRVDSAELDGQTLSEWAYEESA